MSTPTPSLPRSLSTSRSLSMQRLFRETVSMKERLQISQWLLDAEKDLRAEQAEISRLRTLILTMENRSNGLRRSMEKYRSLLSPVHRMPPEILLNIFSFCCERNELDYRAPAVSTLSTVCGRWRDLALSTPALWSSISIRFGYWEEEGDALDRITKFFLERSRASPLRLTLDFTNVAYEIEDVYPTLQALVQAAPRWASVSLTVTPPILANSVFHPIKGRLPILSHLELVPADTGELDDPVEGLELFSDCPALRSVKLSPVVVTEPVSLPFQRITFLELYYSDAENAIMFLNRFPNLTKITFSHVGGGSAEEHVFLNARHLLVIATECTDVMFPLEYTTLCMLSSFDIRGDSGVAVPTHWEDWDPAPLHTFLARSACNLTSLRLSWLPIQDTEAMSLLQNMASLTSLQLDEYRTPSPNVIVTTSFLMCLAVDHGSSSATSALFLPRLVDLRLSVHRAGLDINALVRAVSTRWLPDPTDASEIGVDCLRYLGLHVMGGRDELKALQDFGGAGLRIDISYTA
ncbi:hypothetical protein VNI00_008731 [Paramarasmius palmivorus]|uniref:F-box domain-containing protein n=1 Tax=Paramarasmius palmivorus TaxID=297713 RepID=A0AAW0CT96_9AGAR